MIKIPSKLQGILWSVPLNKIDLKVHKSYLTHQILMFGSFDDIKWLFNVYPNNDIKSIFIDKPQKIYTPEGFNFVKNFVLNLKDQNIPPKNYVNVIHSKS
ncbi:hypothetical protein A2130_00580 [Candidatus Woesebacteria bacterium GWC2_33_12]|uniref:DUF6922 domain-containing protein n=1 Tax=Candidatus Woesebacteria bacterium GW2011_GWB1_33_22 TaxID=1618566 RepID=A0A0F9ZLX8_9BACT|nr:MAG: hypothetical protein UR29_C0002G0008 [Candidatus Woesebacteria bacterium GW2011_GWC2_33_12]KKP42480.1 MAG: hypothetical protein UR33_C0002G0056 [Candidatus Woesebacteria bacterium GW2011_GWA2_33_20]KKP45223.1 MAG: hypothetical protein UR35_C0002G0056 [Candidatus Woesebacteria bacterium GW2011_GWB1_33_22]KKP46482.1 MAG: hypothetical protein UR37_C0007G0039 [Microgenomates group bacterium GW2011_GWC1_33_28]KKP50893.1 MAG: hypothetical protein UR41_C0002G0057 [Candidatus Woesebacteria bact